MKTLIALLAAIGLLVPFAAAQEPGDVEAVLEAAGAAVIAVTASDADTIESAFAEGALLIADEGDDAFVITREELLEVADGPELGPEVEWVVDDDAVDIVGGLAFVIGELKVEPERSVMLAVALLQVEGEWKVASAIGFSDDVEMGFEDMALPEAVADILTDLSEGDVTGMQAALEYLPAEDPAYFLVGGAGFAIPMPNLEAIKAQVGEWEPPADVETSDEVLTMAGNSAAMCYFQSSFTNGEAVMVSQNAVCFVKTEDGWKLVAYLAGLVTEEPAAEEAE